MKTKHLLSIALLLMLSLVFTTSSYAYNYNTYWTSSTKIGIGHFAYGETAGDTDSGTNYSLSQRFNYHNNLFLLSLKGTFGYVSATYNGSTQGGTSTSGTVHYALNNFSVGSGIDYKNLNNLMQNDLYLSLGDMTHDFMAGNSSFTNGAEGYDESYQIKYLSLTYKNIYNFMPRISNVFKLEYLYGINGTATTKGLQGLVIDGYNTNNNLEFNLSGEKGYTIAEGVRYELTRHISLTGDIYYSALFFKHSNNNNAFYEPSSMTHQYGLQIGANYMF